MSKRRAAALVLLALAVILAVWLSTIKPEVRGIFVEGLFTRCIAGAFHRH